MKEGYIAEQAQDVKILTEAEVVVVGGGAGRSFGGNCRREEWREDSAG